MEQRTWPYGTRLEATIQSVTRVSTYDLVVLVDERNEGHLLAGGDHAITPVTEAKVIMEFTKGGERGGYWRIIQLAEVLMTQEELAIGCIEARGYTDVKFQTGMGWPRRVFAYRPYENSPTETERCSFADPTRNLEEAWRFRYWLVYVADESVRSRFLTKFQEGAHKFVEMDIDEAATWICTIGYEAVHDVRVAIRHSNPAEEAR